MPSSEVKLKIGAILILFLTIQRVSYFISFSSTSTLKLGSLAPSHASHTSHTYNLNLPPEYNKRYDNSINYNGEDDDEKDEDEISRDDDERDGDDDNDDGRGAGIGNDGDDDDNDDRTNLASRSFLPSTDPPRLSRQSRQSRKSRKYLSSSPHLPPPTIVSHDEFRKLYQKYADYNLDDYNSCDIMPSMKIRYSEDAQNRWDAWQQAQNFPPNITHYHQLWDATSQTISIPNKNPNDPPTSLEILQDIIHGATTHMPYVARDAPESFVHRSDDEDPDELPACLIPRIEMTQKLADCGIPIPEPILNVGMPKAGCTSLSDFFKCTLNVTNLNTTKLNQRSIWSVVQNHQGKCNRNAMEVEGKPPLSGCPATNSRRILTQMDDNSPPCSFPQISMLDEIHAEYPHATFILNFRPVNHWIQSAANYNRLASRWKILNCRREIPGLIQNREPVMRKRHSTNAADNDDDNVVGPGVRDDDDYFDGSDFKRRWHMDLQQWWCGHVTHIREFVKQHPTHKLIEIDLYDDHGTAELLVKLFKSRKECWGQSNKAIPK